jgi:phospholipid transport system substrate-binding protein
MIRRSFAAAGAVLFAVAALAVLPRGAAAQDALGFVNNLGTQAIAVLGPQVPAEQRLSRFRELFRDDFDVAGIGQFVLGRYWNVASPQQQQEFLRLYSEYIVQAYSARLSEYGGEPFRVTGQRQGDSGTVVTSEVVRQGGSPVEVDWYLIDAGGFKITDVYVGGVSMKVTERDEFGAIIQRSGGNIDALLTQLREKVGG